MDKIYPAHTTILLVIQKYGTTYNHNYMTKLTVESSADERSSAAEEASLVDNNS